MYVRLVTNTSSHRRIGWLVHESVLVLRLLLYEISLESIVVLATDIG